MPVMRKIKVLIVDDSIFFRETLARAIAQDSGIEVVGTARDPFDARDKILSLKPDVLTLDMEMPKMNGIEFLKTLMAQHPLPVIMVSAVNSIVFEALEAGALDFVAKPSASNQDLSSFARDLCIKIKTAAAAALAKRPTSRISTARTYSVSNNNTIVAIGASTGGTEAIISVIREFPANFPPIIMVQHMPPVFTRMYAERINNTCKVNVREAANGDKVVPGTALLAAGDKHLRLCKDPLAGGYILKCASGEKVSGHCPSVDVMFESVAEAAGSNAIGVILTGMGSDGAKGLLKMRKAGAYTIGQDQASCVVYGMPMVAYNIGAVTMQRALQDIPEAIINALSIKNKK